MERGVTMMKAEEIRKKLMIELSEQLLAEEKATTITFAPDEPVVTFPSPNLEKPKMFEPLNIANVKKNETINDNIVRGIGFQTSNIESKKMKNVSCEIYDMGDFIGSNPNTMSTFTYDEKVMKKQLALVKKREWQDILFEDIDWSMQIDLVSPIKKFFGGIKF